MSAPGSSSSSAPKYAAASINTSEVEKLRGSDNYQTWQTAMEYILMAAQVEHVVYEDQTPSEKAPADVAEAFNGANRVATAIIVQSLSGEVLRLLPARLTAHKIWLFVQENFFHDATVNFWQQLERVYETQYNPSTPINS